MRSLPAAVLSELVKEVMMICHLFKLEATSTYRWTDCDQDVWFASNFWYKKGIVFDDFEYNLSAEIPSLSFKFPNADKWFSDLALSEELRGKPFTIYKVLLDSNLHVIGCTLESDLDIIFKGFIDIIPLDRLEANPSIVSHRIKEKGFGPKRTYSTKCWKIFKSAECGYSGAETWCDLSKTRCKALGNAVNFGGWEYIASLVDKELYWGQRVKNWGKT